ncbi:hypothetical protein [Phytoactinopolyspora halotolerans]|uniref:Uncharacterized protein n=1 Tax=Phytoactinopolyspora halotolerans TaxID=1981512 RepID=A0A6L9SDP0_9ACTN|nr:hypothetical protein [Phytoactinopolyspora halotolerans]NEE02160.1 hypothetical protein [Phytoactinopolyspora halotolerans]
MTDHDSRAPGGNRLPWPDGWRWTRRRERAYAARGVDGVRTVHVAAGGFQDSGVLLPMKAMSPWWALLFAFLGLVCVAGAVVLLVAALAQQQWTNLIGFVVLGGFGTIFCLSAVAVTRQRREAVPGLRLTPARIVYDGGTRQSPVSIPWEEIQGIRLFTNRYGYRTIGPRPWHNWFTLEVKDPSAVLEPVGHRATRRLAENLRSRGVVAIPDARWQMDAVVAYRAVLFYLENPDGRRELADTTAVTRIRNGAGHGGLS